jgi:hypothetical protein
LNRDGCHYIQKVTVTGETKLSWTSGPDHALTKYVKRRHEVLTEQDYEDQQWGLKHRFSIGQLVINRIGGKLLRQIADLIGYKPEEEKH